MIKLPKGWTEETIGSKKVLKKIYKYKQTDSMDMINFAGDISELPNYKTNIDFNFITHNVNLFNFYLFFISKTINILHAMTIH